MHIFVQLIIKLALDCNQPPAECDPGNLYSHINLAVCESDSSVTSSAQVKNE
jgi:hypothetical protein